MVVPLVATFVAKVATRGTTMRDSPAPGEISATDSRVRCRPVHGLDGVVDVVVL